MQLIKTTFPHVILVGGGTRVDVEQEIMRSLDWFMLGFSDISFVKLLDHVISKAPSLRYTKHAKFKNTKIVDSNTHYPVIDHDQIETVMLPEDDFQSYQPLPLEVSRGCIFKCAFCTHPFLGKKNYEYIRSAESIARELKRNYELFGTYRYAITDDTFNDSFEKLYRLKNAIELSGIPKFEFVAYIKPEILVTKQDMIPLLGELGLKAALFGIESLNNRARKFVGKGVEVEKVLEVARQLSSYGVKIHATMILGLPGDTINDWHNWQKYFEENSKTLFRFWSWHSLNIRNKNVQFDDVNEGYSAFEKDPEAFGFRDNSGSAEKGERFLDWINDQGITRQQANEHQDILQKQAIARAQFGGWTIVTAWYHNVSDEQIEHSLLGSVKLQSVAINTIKNRAKIQYKLITGKELNFSSPVNLAK
jgi:DNA repair photolyase